MGVSGQSSGPGSKHPVKILANIFISFIGAGILGLPYAFKEGGVIEGTITMIFVSLVSIKAMLLLIDCKYRLTSKTHVSNGALLTSGGDTEKLLATETDAEHKPEASSLHQNLTYGDIGYYAVGNIGKVSVDISIVVSQIGFCCAYLIFITENLADYTSPHVKKWQWLLVALPGLWLLMLLRHLSSLALSSLIAQISNLLALSVVFWFDFEHFHLVKEVHPKTVSLEGFPFFFCVAVYCYEGAGLILGLEASLHETKRQFFKWYFLCVLTVITLLCVFFGLAGYLSFGPETQSIITLNLPKSSSGIDAPLVVKSCLCLSLYFTYPVMMFPVLQILEVKVLRNPQEQIWAGNFLRMAMVLLTAMIVMLIPNFSILIALIGATCCTMIAFVMPGLFHLKLHADSLTRKQRWLDYFLIILGIFACIIGTHDALSRIAKDAKVDINLDHTPPVPGGNHSNAGNQFNAGNHSDVQQIFDNAT